MTQMSVQEFNDDELTKQLRHALQNWPLYRRLEYKGADSVTAVPGIIQLVCTVCKFRTQWQTTVMNQMPNHPRGTTIREKHKTGFCQKTYKCKNCGIKWVTCYFFWGDELGVSVFYKVGQYPELEERVSETLAKALGADDLKAYQNALRLRNFNLGIAAVAYMRRVVENRLNDLLEVLHEAATVHGAPAKLLARHQAMMKEKRFTAKVDYAGNLLPKNLRPEGKPNPMAILHELASDGLHAKTDEECVDIFDACRETFEYVYGKMRIETEDAKKFVSGIATLTEKRAKLAPAQKPKPEPQ
jgi:hypothetical protein